MTETTSENFNNIKLKPHLFKEYLEQIGFKILTTISTPAPLVTEEGIPNKSFKD